MKKGFTIIECLISMVLLAIILTGGMAFYFNATKISAITQHREAALQIAIDRMERAKAGDLTTETTPVNINPSPAFPFSENFGTIEIYRTTSLTDRTDLDSLPSPYAVQEFNVQIDWQEPDGGSNQTVVLSTYL